MSGLELGILHCTVFRSLTACQWPMACFNFRRLHFHFLFTLFFISLGVLSAACTRLRGLLWPGKRVPCTRAPIGQMSLACSKQCRLFNVPTPSPIYFLPSRFFFRFFFLCASRFFVMRLRHFLELVFEFFLVLCKPWFHYPDCVVDRKAHFAQSHRPLSTGPFSVRAFMSGCFVCNNSQVLYRRVNCL